MRFVDTNILLYALSKDPAEADKAHIARSLLDHPDLALSVQVLQEFYVQATRPGRKGALSHKQACQLIESFLRFPVQEITTAIMHAALALTGRFKIAYWDAAVIESARALRCETVLSEDLNHGQIYNGVRIVNPFRPRTARESEEL